MQKKRTMRAVALVLVALAPASAVAETRCSGMLAGGIYEFRDGVSPASRSRSFKSWFCSRNFKSIGDFVEHAVGTTSTPLNGIPKKAGIYDRDLQWEEFFSEACRTGSTFENELDWSQGTLQRLNERVSEAWKECLERDGLQAALIVGGDPREFRVEFSYLNTSGMVFLSSLRITNITVAAGVQRQTCRIPEGAKYLSESKDAMQVRVASGEHVTLDCTRTRPEDDVRVEFQSELGMGAAELRGMTISRLATRPSTDPRAQ
jgi:hypothetical protein